MVITYLTLKAKIIYRFLAEIGIIRLLILLPFITFFYVMLFIKTNTIPYSSIVLIAIYTYSIIHYTLSRNDIYFLKVTTKNYKRLLFVDNILFSIPFIILNIKTAPIIILIGYFISHIDFNRILFVRNIKITKSLFKYGSIEWESNLRRYGIYSLIIWIVLYPISIIYQEKYLAFIALGGFCIDSASIFLNTDPSIYLIQFQSRHTFLKHKLLRILTNIYLPTIIFAFAIFTVFPDQLIILLFICLIGFAYIIAAFTIKMAVLNNQFILTIIQIVFFAITIGILFNHSLIILFLIFIIYCTIKALNNLKEIYD